MTALRCPHDCGIAFDRAHAQKQKLDIGQNQQSVFRVIGYQCPGCSGVVYEHVAQNYRRGTNGTKMLGTITSATVIYPRTSPKAPAEVPAELANEFNEASAVLADSPRAAAALARRSVQHILREHHGATGGNLANEIDSVSDRLPPYINESLHALRHIGNFAAHPTKDRTTGEVVPVEPGEAEWTLEVLEALFQFTFVGPARQQERRDALNLKLKAAGKPLLPVPESSDS